MVNSKSYLERKVDTGADTCVLTTEDLQNLKSPIGIQPCGNTLKAYRENTIENYGSASLHLAYNEKST